MELIEIRLDEGQIEWSIGNIPLLLLIVLFGLSPRFALKFTQFEIFNGLFKVVLYDSTIA